jgi:hypothetical protein
MQTMQYDSLMLFGMPCRLCGVQALPHQGVTLMKAPWPTHAGAVDAAAVTQFEQLKELVRGVRNARTEYGLEQARKVGRPGTVQAPVATGAHHPWLVLKDVAFAAVRALLPSRQCSAGLLHVWYCCVAYWQLPPAARRLSVLLCICPSLLNCYPNDVMKLAHQHWRTASAAFSAHVAACQVAAVLVVSDAATCYFCVMLTHHHVLPHVVMLLYFLPARLLRCLW